MVSWQSLHCLHCPWPRPGPACLPTAPATYEHASPSAAATGAAAPTDRQLRGTATAARPRHRCPGSRDATGAEPAASRRSDPAARARPPLVPGALEPRGGQQHDRSRALLRPNRGNVRRARVDIEFLVPGPVILYGRFNIQPSVSILLIEAPGLSISILGAPQLILTLQVPRFMVQCCIFNVAHSIF